ncbi:MAG: histidine kinase [Anaerolineae bacterium]|nr:histidine kinase [Anaerolineae bacterium]
MRTWLRSLNAQMFLWAVLPVMLVITALGTTSFYMYQRKMQDFVGSRDLSLAYGQARMLAHLLEDGAIGIDGAGLTRWLDNLTLDMPPLMVIDGQGIALVHPDKARIGTYLNDLPGLQNVISRQAGSSVVGRGREAVIVSFALVYDTDWRVVIVESVHSFIGPALRFSQFGPVIAMIAIAISLLIIGFNWLTVVRPLRLLSAVADQISGHSYPRIPLPRESVHEVESLHNALSAMVDRIREYEVSIRQYLDATTQGQEEERARIAREIHDGPVQEIIALGQRIDIVRSSIVQDDGEEAQELLAEMRTTQLAPVEELRRIVNALRPVYLEDLGFLPALEMLAQQANTRGQVQVHIKVEGKIKRLPLDVELAAYRITQEALNNALQHANAREINVQVSCSGMGLSLEITDDGDGFMPPENLDILTRFGRFGLLGIRERTGKLGGVMALESAPGRGTILKISLPGCDEIGIAS